MVREVSHLRETVAERVTSDKLACVACGHLCCKYQGFVIVDPSDKELELYKVKKLRTYGQMLPDGRMVIIVYVPYVCPTLNDGDGCEDYANRPRACVEYRGKDDPLLRDVCRVS